MKLLCITLLVAGLIASMDNAGAVPAPLGDTPANRGDAGSSPITCPKHGWRPAKDFCFRIVHYDESFDGAYNWCLGVSGFLLSLAHVKDFMEAIGTSMQGNAADFRIDGRAEGQWFQGNNENLTHDDYELLTDLTGKSLTVNVQDGQVSGDTEVSTRMHFICEGNPEDLKSCSQEEAAQGRAVDDDESPVEGEIDDGDFEDMDEEGNVDQEEEEANDLYESHRNDSF